MALRSFSLLLLKYVNVYTCVCRRSLHLLSNACEYLLMVNGEFYLYVNVHSKASVKLLKKRGSIFEFKYKL